MTKSKRKMPLAGNTCLRQFFGGKKKRSGRNDIVLAAMNKKNWRRGTCRHVSREILPIGNHERAGISKDRRRSAAAPQTGMKGKHGALAETDQSQLAVVQSMT